MRRRDLKRAEEEAWRLRTKEVTREKGPAPAAVSDPTIRS
jgi:hypothetical protein